MSVDVQIDHAFASVDVLDGDLSGCCAAFVVLDWVVFLSLFVGAGLDAGLESLVAVLLSLDAIFCANVCLEGLSSDGAGFDCSLFVAGFRSDSDFFLSDSDLFRSDSDRFLGDFGGLFEVGDVGCSVGDCWWGFGCGFLLLCCAGFVDADVGAGTVFGAGSEVVGLFVAELSLIDVSFCSTAGFFGGRQKRGCQNG
jgi:hypothetical protein